MKHRRLDLFIYLFIYFLLCYYLPSMKMKTSQKEHRSI